MFCSKCGTNLPNGAAFCNKCGAKIADKRTSANEGTAPIAVADSNAKPTASANPQATTQSDSASTKDKSEVLSVIRLILLIVAGGTIFFPWLTYKGAISGTTNVDFIHTLGQASYNLVHNGNLTPIFLILMATGAILMAVGSIAGIGSSSTAGKRLALIGGLMVTITVMIVIGFSPTGSVSVANNALASLTVGAAPWVCVICSGAATLLCFVK